MNDNKPKTFDFRPSKCGWGHNIHSSTFSLVPDSLWRRLIGKARRRCSFMVHCWWPSLGDRVIWTAANGDRTGEIYKIESCSGVDDMYTLYVEVKDASK